MSSSGEVEQRSSQRRSTPTEKNSDPTPTNVKRATEQKHSNGGNQYSSLLAFISISIGIIVSFITMGIVQEKISHKTYADREGQTFKMNFVYLPIFLQSIFCTIFAKAWIGFSKRKETDLLLHRDVM